MTGNNITCGNGNLRERNGRLYKYLNNVERNFLPIYLVLHHTLEAEKISLTCGVVTARKIQRVFKKK
jgi:hypothetical protein